MQMYYPNSPFEGGQGGCRCDVKAPLTPIRCSPELRCAHSGLSTFHAYGVTGALPAKSDRTFIWITPCKRSAARGLRRGDLLCGQLGRSITYGARHCEGGSPKQSRKAPLNPPSGGEAFALRAIGGRTSRLALPNSPHEGGWGAIIVQDKN